MKQLLNKKCITFEVFRKAVFFLFDKMTAEMFFCLKKKYKEHIET